MRFEFATATRLIFGPGTLQEVPSIVAGIGRRALVVTGRSTERASPLIEALIAVDNGLSVTTFSVTGEPTTDLVQEGAEFAR